jgi:hypothetical protein
MPCADTIRNEQKNFWRAKKVNSSKKSEQLNRLEVNFKRYDRMVRLIQFGTRILTKDGLKQATFFKYLAIS